MSRLRIDNALRNNSLPACTGETDTAAGDEAEAEVRHVARLPAFGDEEWNWRSRISFAQACCSCMDEIRVSERKRANASESKRQVRVSAPARGKGLCRSAICNCESSAG